MVEDEEEDLDLEDSEEVEEVEEEDESYMPQVGYSALGVSGLIVGIAGVGFIVKNKKKKMDKTKRLRILSNENSIKANLLQSHTM